MDPFAEQPQEGGLGFDPRQLLRIFLRRKWLFIVPFILCLAMAGVAIMTMHPVFFSVGQIHVICEATSAKVLPNEVSRYGGRTRDRDREVFSNIQIILTGPKFLQRVVQELNRQHPEVGLPDDILPAGQAMVGEASNRLIARASRRLARRIRVEQEGSYLFNIGVRDTDPQRAFLLARLVLDRFLEEERAGRLAPATTTRDFLEGQKLVFEQELATAEQRLNSFQRSMLSVSLAGNPINERNLGLGESALVRLRSQFFDSDTSELFDAEQQARRVLGVLPQVSHITQDSEVATAVRDLASLEFEQTLGRQAVEGDLERQNTLGSLRLRLNTLVEARTAQDYPQLGVMDRNRVSQYLYLRVYREVRQQVIARLEQNIQVFKDFTTRQPEQSAELSRLQQEVEAAREMVRAIRRDIAQESMRLEASMSEIGYKMVVRQDPNLPGKPVEPDKAKLGFMGFVLALCLGGGLVILAQLLDRSFHSVPQIERALGLAVIGTLPVIENEFFQRKRMRRIWTWTVLTLAILLVAAAGLLFVYPRLS